MKAKAKEKLARVVVTNPMIGICFMQVCACKDATDEEILDVANTENLCGTSRGWAHVWRTEDEGETEAERKAKLPGQCDDYPDRLHFIINC